MAGGHAWDRKRIITAESIMTNEIDEPLPSNAVDAVDEEHDDNRSRKSNNSSRV